MKQTNNQTKNKTNKNKNKQTKKKKNKKKKTNNNNKKNKTKNNNIYFSSAVHVRKIYTRMYLYAPRLTFLFFRNYQTETNFRFAPKRLFILAS